MASFFGGNPFSTVVGRKIEEATDPTLPPENWTAFMHVCDLINESEDGPKEAIKAIRKRLSQSAAKNFSVVMNTLTLLETCVKNCNRGFIVLVCTKDFIQELVKLIGPKNDPPPAIQEKVLYLIQCWAAAFRDQPEMYGVVQVYTDLRQKGIEFPFVDTESLAPILEPPNDIVEEDRYSPISNFSLNYQVRQIDELTPDQLGKLHSEIRVVEGNMAVLNEMLNELVPGQEPPGDLELLQELHTTCKEMQDRLIELISQLTNDEITGDLLRVNDGLNNLFLRYSRYEKNRKAIPRAKPKEENVLIDLNDNSPPNINSQLANLSLNQPSPPKEVKSFSSLLDDVKDDDFDIFAQSRNITSDPNVDGDNPYETVRGYDTFEDSLALALRQRQKSHMHSEQDFDEMAAWLGEKEESVSSSEFERFLAERAAAAENLPPATENGPSTSSSKRQNKEKDTIIL